MRHIIGFLLGTLFVFGQNFTHDSIQIKHIFDYTLRQGEAYEWLRDLTQNVGHRLSGSPQAEKAVAWGKELMEEQGFDNVWLQPVMVPHWVRGEKETAYFTTHGKKKPVPIIALGGSVSTPKEGVKGKVIEVESIEHLKAIGDQVKDKIVFINQKMDETLVNTFHAYGGCAGIRFWGAHAAGSLGAKAVITRSLTTQIDDYPHTGVMTYEDLPEEQKIPTAAISTKGAEALSKALKEDSELLFYFQQSCQTLPDAPSFNVIGQITGTKYPEKVMTIGGHLDSWDVGEGAHDDGTGIVHSLQVLKTFKALGIKPRHTLRVVFFMNEENGNRGGKKYAEEAKQKGEQHVLALESDAGGHSPRGFSIDTEKEEIITVFKSWRKLLEPYGVHQFEEGYPGVDIFPLKEQFDLVLNGFKPDSQRYFDYHHTELDTFDKVNERELELGAAAMTSLIYLYDQYLD